MTKPPPSQPAPALGRLTGFVLGFVVFICLILVGSTGYLKFQLDRAVTTLTSPASTLEGDYEILDKLRRILGFSGFVGMAQNYAITRDQALLADMHEQLKTAHEIISHLPSKTPPESQHDIEAISGMFDAVMAQADKAAGSSDQTFGYADLTPLYAAIPVLDVRLEDITALSRVAAQNEAEFWSMILTFVSWASLIVTCAMAVGVYLTLTKRQSTPLRALTQSVRNLSHGDLRTSMWGMERQDAIGELARAIDMARYHFSQMPDMALLSDQGPIRLRFEGNTRSMFEAMMSVISRDSEQVRGQAIGLTEAIVKQHEVISLLASRVEAILHNVEKRSLDGDRQVKNALHNVLGSAEALKHAQEHAADQLNRVVPFLQERAQGMAEITQIAGKQIARSLQSLTLSEHGLKTSAEQSKDAITKLATTADDLGGRLFGAVNLLQASGKILSETTETAQSRLNEAVAHLSQSVSFATGTPAPRALDPGAPNLVPRIEGAIVALEAVQSRLEERLAQQNEVTKTHLSLLSSQSTDLVKRQASVSETVSAATVQLREEQAKFDQTVMRVAARLDEIGSKIETETKVALDKSNAVNEQSLQQLSSLSTQLDRMTEKLSSLDRAAEAIRSPAMPPFVGALQNDIREGLSTTVKNIEELRTQLTSLATAATETPSGIKDQLRDHWFQMAGQIEATRDSLSTVIVQQVERIESRIAGIVTQKASPDEVESAQQVMEQQTQILSELVATMSILDTHMQDIRSQVAGIAEKKAG